MDIWQRWLTQERFAGLDPDEEAGVRQFISLARQRLLASLELRPGMTLLLVGCGDGEWLPELLARVPGGRIVALDVSAGLLEIARARLQGSEMGAEADRVTWLCQDIRRPLPAALACDAVCGRSVLQYVAADLPAVLAGLHGALRPGGRLAFFEASPGDDPVALPVALPDALRVRLAANLEGVPWMAGAGDYWRALRGSPFREVQLQQERTYRRSPVTPRTVDSLLASRPYPGQPSLAEVLMRGLGAADRERVQARLTGAGDWVFGSSWCFLSAVA